VKQGLDLKKNQLEDYKMDKSQYKILSELFLYPTEGYHNKVNECMLMLQEKYPDAAKSFVRFSDYINSKTLYEVEEVFGFTFHIQAICFLDIGYVLFGEDYNRGEFLVNMKREQAKINHDYGDELADNLPHVLQLLAKSDDIELVQELSIRAVIPAIEKMLEEFQQSKMELKAKVMKKKQKAIIMEDIVDGNIYQNAIQSLLFVLKNDFEGVEYGEKIAEPSLSNFLPNCGTC
jgi:nitrate reductase assembly molybdenum cofactor insertion protein NarJ